MVSKCLGGIIHYTISRDTKLVQGIAITDVGNSAADQLQAIRHGKQLTLQSPP